MSTPPPAIQNLARKLIAIAPAPVGPSSHGADQAVQACEKLRVPLTKLAGLAGFISLLSRALALAKRQVSSFAEVRVGADGSLEGVEKIPSHLATAEMLPEGENGGVVLVAELLGLLVVLIGEPLTLRLVREAWPEVSLDTITLSSKETP